MALEERVLEQELESEVEGIQSALGKLFSVFRRGQ